MDDDLTALGAAVQGLLARACPPAAVRAGWFGSGASAVWAHLAGIGVPALLVPPEAGGLGLDETALVVVLERTGYAAVPAPTVETVAVGAPLLAGTFGQVDLLGAVLSGAATLTFTRSLGRPVPYGQTADVVLVWDGADLTLVLPSERTAESSVDGGRRLAQIGAGTSERLTVSSELLRVALLRGALGTAAELVGLSRRMIDMTVPYVIGREQFGVPIGSFQAIKHHLADALLAVEFAAPLVDRGARSLATGAPTARLDVSMAKAAASDAATRVAKLTLQCHGAMAYTTEYDHHLYAKRAWAQAGAWGSAPLHRRVVASELGLDDGETEGRPL